MSLYFTIKAFLLNELVIKIMFCTFFFSELETGHHPIPENAPKTFRLGGKLE